MVAPYAGAWIETETNGRTRDCKQSLPTRERGLKQVIPAEGKTKERRSLRGSVD